MSQKENQSEDVHFLETVNTGANKRRADAENSVLRAKRNCKPIERLGLENINDDSLFIAIDNSLRQFEQLEPHIFNDILGDDTEIIELEREKTYSENTVEEKGSQSDGAEKHSQSFDDQINSQSDELAKSVTFSAGEKVILKLIVELAADVKLVKKHLSDILCKIQEQKEEGTVQTHIDEDELAAIELPLKNKLDLDQFEAKLKHKDFKDQVVSIFF